MEREAFFNTFSVAGIGPVSIKVGSDPTTVRAITRNFGFKPSDSAFSRDMIGSRRPPPLLCLDFPRLPFPRDFIGTRHLPSFRATVFLLHPCRPLTAVLVQS